MTKREIESGNVKMVINLIENQFNGSVEDNGEGGRLDIFVDGYLKWTVDDFDEFLFRELDEYREKQEGVPFNYSWGGGTQGLIETNTVNGPDVKDEDLVIQNNFAGTFEGSVATFKMYGCVLDVTLIRYDYNKTKSRFGF